VGGNQTLSIDTRCIGRNLEDEAGHTDRPPVDAAVRHGDIETAISGDGCPTNESEHAKLCNAQESSSAEVANSCDSKVASSTGQENLGPCWQRWLPLGLIALSSVGFSVQALVVKELTLSGVPTFQALIIRGTCQALGCILTLAVKKRHPKTWLGESLQEVQILVPRAVIGFGGIAFGFLSISYLPLSESQVLQQVVPVFAATYARIFLKEPWYCTEFLSALSAIAGVVFIARPAPFFAASDATDAHALDRSLGITCALLSAASAGGAYVIIKLLGTKLKVDWPVVLLYQALGQVLLCPPAMLVARQSLIWLAPKQVGMSLLVGFLGFWSQAAMTYGMQREKSATATVARQALSPVSAFVLQITFEPGDPLFWSTFVGFAIILSGLVLTVMGKAMRSSDSKEKSGPIPKGNSVLSVESMCSNDAPSPANEVSLLKIKPSKGYKRLKEELQITDVIIEGNVAPTPVNTQEPQEAQGLPAVEVIGNKTLGA